MTGKYSRTELATMANMTITGLQQRDPRATRSILELSRRTGLSQTQVMDRILTLAVGGVVP